MLLNSYLFHLKARNSPVRGDVNIVRTFASMTLTILTKQPSTAKRADKPLTRARSLFNLLSPAAIG